MRIITFGAHPDDVEVGMGGTIRKFAENGHNVLIVVATMQNHDVRTKESVDASKVLGADIRLLNIAPEKLIFEREIVNAIGQIIDEVDPDEVYTHWDRDSHQDHNNLTSAVIAASRRNKFSVYMYEQTIPGGLTGYGFAPHMFVDISGQMEAKIDSILKHASQVEKNGQEDWLYGIKGRAQYRGYQIGVKFAEAFQVVKHLKKIE